MAAIITDSTGDGRFPTGKESVLVKQFASTVTSPVVTRSILKKASINIGGASPESSEEPTKANKTTPDHNRENAVLQQDVPQTPAAQQLNSNIGIRNVEDKNIKTGSAEAPPAHRLKDVDELLNNLDRITGIDPSLFTNENAHPLALMIALYKWFETSWLEWEPETLWSEIRDFGVNDTIPRIVKDRIMAVRAAHRINSYVANYQDFEFISAALNGVIPDFTMYRPSSIPEIANSMEILQWIRQDDEYQEEIIAYVRIIAKNEGWLVLPETLAFAQDEHDETFIADVRERAAQLGASADSFNIESVIDGQAIRLAACKKYQDGEERNFSDCIAQYMYFKR